MSWASRRDATFVSHGKLRNPVIAALAVLFALGCAERAEPPRISLSVGKTFAGSVDLESIRLVAVQDGGRVKTFDSLAREKLKLVNGSRSTGDIDPVLLYLDMMLIPEHYAGIDTIHIRKPPIRQRIVQMIRNAVPPPQRQGPLSEGELDRIVETGNVSIEFLDQPVVRSVLESLERDLMSSNKEVQKIYTARSLADVRTMRALWAVVPPPGGDSLDPWFPLTSVAESGAPSDATHASMGAGGGVPGLEPDTARSLTAAWNQLQQAWRFQDAQAVSGALNAIATTLAGVAPDLYPSQARRAWEHWYYRNNKLTATWVIYFLALPFLLMSAVYGFRWARRVGLGLFGAAFVLHTISIVVRWYLAGRIPNANMFEAITAAAWFGVLIAMVIEFVLRRWPLKNFTALAASTGAMVGMMLGHFFPITLNNDIAPVMPVLDNTIWLYIHTNMIIASYALIFFGSVTAGLYLLIWTAQQILPSAWLATRWAGTSGESSVDGGGAATIILGRGLEPGESPNSGLAKVLDGTTMIFLELAFITLWFGTILGAAWAYFSWGRPWGWDPKEVFALNTWLVFLVLVHVRIKVKDKGFWTAVLAVIGCMVMIFNWYVVNFIIVGLHSYA